jgi:uncharacterized membrane protein
MTLETNKNLGGVGAILMFIGAIPFTWGYFGWLIALVGLILVLIAAYNLASYYSERGIFNNALYGVIAAIVGVVGAAGAAIFAVLTSLTDFLYKIYPGWNGDWTALSGLTPNTSNLSLSDILPFVAGIIAVFIILWIFAIIAAFFVRRSLSSLSAKSGVGLFSTTGLLMLIGAVLIIIVGIGLVLIWIGFILLAVAFFSLRPQQTAPQTAPTQV